MKYDKIMAGDNLENIVSRLTGCRLLLCILTDQAECSTPPTEVLQSVANLLESICRDFQADIDGAEDYTGKVTEA